jgi:hypothetical protein
MLNSTPGVLVKKTQYSITPYKKSARYILSAYFCIFFIIFSPLRFVCMAKISSDLYGVYPYNNYFELFKYHTSFHISHPKLELEVM